MKILSVLSLKKNLRHSKTGVVPSAFKNATTQYRKGFDPFSDSFSRTTMIKNHFFPITIQKL